MTSFRFMLDTNALSILATGRSAAADAWLRRQDMSDICTSVISEAEVLFGIAKAPHVTRNATLMQNMLAKISVLPWQRQTAGVFGRLRADMKCAGKSLAPLDMLIAAHALEVRVALVSSDRAFRFVPGLAVEDLAG